MSSEQAARLVATIEVLTGAVEFLIAERVAAQPEAIRGALLDSLQGALAKPSGPAAAAGSVAPMRAERDRWTPVAAAGLIDAVRRQIAGLAEADPTDAQPAARVRAPDSEVAEGPSREHARDAVAHFELWRAVA